MTTFPFDEVKEKIECASSITILSHINPDADALGTALGIYALLKRHTKKRVEVVNASKVLPLHLNFLPFFQRVKHKIDHSESLVISCDCGSIDRLGFDLTGRTIINIDHHQSNTCYGEINVVLPSFASSSQVAYRLFREIYPVDADAATCFYTALLSDTRYFTTSSVNAEVLKMAQELVELGAQPDRIAA
ncbi:MAG TPA: bifunctional oligoribonuclease/PAP phosphatase NrnA, partial [Epsilonproteobacteria bacterium]|nr:bifunctional oligoribonuclease/PAP phosphatase NrnA [Campylobacterota bacterium]